MSLLVRRLSMFETIKNSLYRQGDCIRFICKSRTDNDDEDCDDCSTAAITVKWLEDIASRLATFWALSEREFIVDEMHKLNPEGVYHVKWLSKLFLSFYPSLENDLRLKNSQTVESFSSPDRSRAIGDLTGKGRRNSMLQLEKNWKSVQVSKKNPVSTPPKSPVATATTPIGVLRMNINKEVNEAKSSEKRKQTLEVDQRRVKSISEHLYREVEKILRNCAVAMKANNISIDEVERDLGLHYPHGDLIDSKNVMHALKLFGRNYTTTGEARHVFKYLENVAENVTDGLLEHQKEKANARSAVALKKKYPLWRDLLLMISNFAVK